MYDIASNSARFDCPKELSVQTEIEMKIVPPGRHTELRIKGKIIRRAETTESYGHAYVVQFSPFGKGYRYNTYQCKSSLRQYIQAMKAQRS